MLSTTKHQMVQGARRLLRGVIQVFARAACTCGLSAPAESGIDATASFALVL